MKGRKILLGKRKNPPAKNFFFVPGGRIFKSELKKHAFKRILKNELGFSLGKLNYCLQQLKKKGYVKINNFKKNENKSGYLYLLTPKGIMEKTKITLAFMKRKMKEYDELKREIKDK